MSVVRALSGQIIRAGLAVAWSEEAARYWSSAFGAGCVAPMSIATIFVPAGWPSVFAAFSLRYPQLSPAITSRTLVAAAFARLPRLAVECSTSAARPAFTATITNVTPAMPQTLDICRIGRVSHWESPRTAAG